MLKSETSVDMTAPATRVGVLLATGLGLGYAPVLPGTAGPLGSVVLFERLSPAAAIAGGDVGIHDENFTRHNHARPCARFGGTD